VTGRETMGSKVALIKGDDRYENVIRALALIEGDVDLGDRKHVLIKPNFVSTTRQLAATHVDAVRAVLDWLRSRYDGPITIGEGAALSDTFEGYRNFGYVDIAEEYGVRLLDLNRDKWVPVQIYDRRLAPMQVRVAKTALESDLRISIGPPKTHDTVIITASLKNMVVGSLIRGSGGGPAEGVDPSGLDAISRSDKFAIHQGYQAINLNLYALAKLLAPHLSVIDGFVGMEGEGPVNGDPVELGVAIASADFLAADAVAVKLMGFDLDEIGYLHYCQLGGLGTGDLREIEIVGNATLEDCAKEFRPHPTYRQQLGWQIPDVERFL